MQQPHGYDVLMLLRILLQQTDSLLDGYIQMADIMTSFHVLTPYCSSDKKMR